MDLLKEQLWIEEEGHLEAKAKYLRQVGSEGEGLLNTMGESLVAICAPVLADVFKEWRDEVGRGKGASRKLWFRDLNVDSLGVAIVTLRTMLQKTNYRSTKVNPSINSVCMAIHEALYIEDAYQMVRKANKGNIVAGNINSAKSKFNKNLDEELGKHVSFKKRKNLIELARNTYTDFEAQEADDKLLKGKVLLELAMKMKAPLTRDSKILSPLFVTERRDGRMIRLEMSEDLSNYLLKYKQFKAGNAVDLKPMVVPPLPWSGIFGGGYRTLRCQLKAPLIRTMKTRVYKDSDFAPSIYKACNVIQNTPWKINKGVYAVMRYCYDNELQIADLPVLLSELELPPSVPNEEWEEMTPVQKKAVMTERKAKRSFIESQRSKVVAFGSKMTMCMKFLKYPELYFPHSFDFRGRIYPVATPVNPQSDKYGQALLTFAKKKKLGVDGVKWWKIHGANCWGLDKESYEDRVSWIGENHDLILSWAKEPLKHREDWSKADDPWNFLAFALEYAEAHSKGCPEVDYESSLPIKLDATSSGLQHYSAIFRDQEGALATNLTSDENRQDIYGLVAKEAKLQGVSLLTEGIAEGLSKQILRTAMERLDRSTCKPATMCLPYGITEYGSITDTIEMVGEGLFGNTIRDLPVTSRYNHSAWIARRILGGVSSVVTSAVIGMQWLKDSEKAIQAVNKDNQYLKYFTRLGFPSQQTYNKSTSKRVNTFLGKTRVVLVVKKAVSDVDKRKSQSSIAPNYIHSMDATHLLMTALKAHDAGGMRDFSFIHDSFGVHASDTEDFSRIIRETFVTLYKGDVLEDLRNQWLTQFPTADIPEVPKTAYGTYELEEVLKSRYFFS